MLTLVDQIRQVKSIRKMIQVSTEFLHKHHIGEAKENAELLFLYIANWTRATFLLNMMEPYEEQWVIPYSTVIMRKAKGEPYQYITGEQYFYGRKFLVNEHVLIPRPETELLVEKVIQSITQQFGNQPLTVLDVGTGSGAIALSLKAEMPHLNVIASDISAEALNIAKQNADYHQLEVSFVEGDLLSPFIEAEGLAYNGQPIDILVSNPPYIPDGDKPTLQIEVEKYEPHLALFGGVDGLAPYKAMLSAINKLTKKPNIVAFELGIHQPPIVAKHMQELGIWEEVDIITDYNGLERHIIATKK